MLGHRRLLFCCQLIVCTSTVLVQNCVQTRISAQQYQVHICKTSYRARPISCKYIRVVAFHVVLHVSLSLEHRAVHARGSCSADLASIMAAALQPGTLLNVVSTDH